MTIKVGVNYPSFNYGWDFGQPPTVKQTNKPADLPHWYTKQHDGSLAIEPLLKCLKQMGVYAVRWFILGDGWNYDLQTPRFKGDKPFDPPPIADVKDFKQHFNLLLKTFKKVGGIKLMPVLLDFKMFLPVQEVDPTVNVKQGRATVATDEKKRDFFVTNVVKPLITLSAGYKNDVILAWDVINEPELAKLDKDVLEPLLVACLEAVKAAGMDRTIGWQHADTAAQWTKASPLVTMPQFHYYPESIGDAPLKPATATKAKILGEIATETNGSPKWKELAAKGKDTVEERIRLAAAQGYEAVFLWSVNGAAVTDPKGRSTKPDERTRWDDSTRKGIVAYTKKSVCSPSGQNIGDLAR